MSISTGGSSVTLTIGRLVTAIFTGRLTIAAAVVGAGTLMLGLMLDTERQWLVLVIIVVAGLVRVLFKWTGLDRGVTPAFTGDPRVPALLLILGGLGVAGVLYDNHFPLLMLATVSVYGLACLGLTIQFGFAGVINFAGAAFFGIGCYTAAVLGSLSAPSILILPAAALVAAAIGSVLIAPVLRTKGYYAALITIAFGILFRTFLEVNAALGGPQGLKVASLKLFGFDFSSGIDIGAFEASFYLNYVVLALALFALGVILTRYIEDSWIGLNMDLVRADETAAATFGINVARWRITAFLLGNAIIGLAGAVYGMMTGFVAPNNFDFSDSLMLLAIIILGGVGNLWGIVPAAVLVLVVPEKLQAFGEYRFLLFSILVVLVLRFQPAGLFPRALRTFNRERAP